MAWFEIKTDTTVCPDLVDSQVYGHHRSVVSRRGGYREWFFEDQDGGRLFAQHVKEGRFRRRKGAPQ